MSARNRLVGAAMVGADVAAVGAAWLLACALRFAGFPVPLIREAPPLAPYLYLLAGIAAVWPVAFLAFGLYRPRRLARRTAELWDIVRACAAATLFLAAFSFFLRTFEFSRLVFIYFWLLATLGVAAEREAFRWGLGRWRRRAQGLRRGRHRPAAPRARPAPSHGATLRPMLRRALGFTRPYGGRLGVAMACMAGSALLGTASIAALQPAVDLFLAPGGGSGLSLPPAAARLLGGVLGRLEVAAGADRLSLLGSLCAVLLVLVIVRGFLQFAEEYLLVYVAEAVVRDVRAQAAARVHRLPLAFLARHPKGDLLVRLTADAELLGQAVTVLFQRGVRESFVLAAGTLVLLAIHWQLALAALLLLPLSFAVVARIGRRIFQRTSRVQEGLAVLAGRLQEALGAVRIVKAFGAEPEEAARAHAHAEAVFRRSLRRGQADAVVSPLLEILAWAGSILLLWAGWSLVVRGVLTPGQLVAFLGVLGSMYQPVRRLGRVNAALQRGLGGARRVFEVLDEAPEVLERPGAVPLPRARDRVSFHGVCFAYEPGRPVLRDVTFAARLGEVVAIVGPTGAGKTTLMNLLPRLYDPTGGWIAIDGTDIRTVPLRSLREQIGLVTQETHLFADTVASNIAYGRQGIARARIEEAAAAAGALDFIRRLPRGFETPLGEAGATLSGGERQRLAIARALLADPPILILDEATSALDAETERAIQAALAGLVAGRTTFVIGHRLSTIMGADTIVVLEEGRLVDMGTHADLLARAGTYRRIYRAQLIPA